MRIYLIGYMGSGKSSLGKKLASRMGFSYIDLDKLIEEEQQQSVRDIFLEMGENAFRSLERLALHSTFNKDNLVVSTGGGSPVYFDNMDLMNTNGLTVYLLADADVLVNRLLNKQHLRPLIAGMSQEELHRFIEEQLKIRSSFYEKAKFHIQAKNLNPAILHAQIRAYLENQELA
jgi:shikimate kinase